MAGFLAKPQSNHTNSLSRRLEASDGVIYLTENVVEDVGYMVIEPDTSNQEIIKYTSKAAGYVSGGIRRLSTVGSAETAGTGIAHPAGATVEMRDVHYYFARIIDALNGVSATSANKFYIGENVNTASAITTGTLKGVFYTAGTSASLSTFCIGLSANGYGVWSDDGGSTFNRLSTTGGAIATGDGWQNAAGVGNVVVADLISATAGISSKNDNFIVNEAWNPTWSGNHTFTGTTTELSATNTNLRGTKISCLAEELNQMVRGASAYATLTASNLSENTDGGDISPSLHTHAMNGVVDSRAAGSTGNQTISFGTTAVRLISITAYCSIGGTVAHSKGFAETAAIEGCIYNLPGGAVSADSSNIIRLIDSTGTAVAIGNIDSVAVGSFVINWTTNTSAGAIRFLEVEVWS